MSLTKDKINYFKKLYKGHEGPNGEVVGDYVICINEKETLYLWEGNKYMILNPDGGNGDVCVYTGRHIDPLDESYYNWDRFMTLDKYRENQIDIITS